MADMEARREARRRRILQSSEDRMNLVLGQQRNESPDEQMSAESKHEPVVNASQNASEVVSSSDIRHRKPISAEEEGISGETKKLVKNTVKISPLKKPTTAMGNNTKINANDSLNTSRSTSEAKMMLKHFEFLRIVLCFIVAFLCRRVLATGYGLFYVQTIILPFACLETGFFMFKHNFLHNVILPHRSSMLVGMLMLIGLKPNILQLYNKTMGYMTAASEDFALFFFAFMMAHMFLV